MASRGPSEATVVEQDRYVAAQQIAQDTDPRIRAQRHPHQLAVCWISRVVNIGGANQSVIPRT